MNDGVRKITVSVQTGQDTPSYRQWLVFSSPVVSKAIFPTMTVDIAFQLHPESGEIQPATNDKLYTYFPTELETHIDFLMNGFSLNPESGEIQLATNAKLYTYFPTELETHVGFLMNGPYRTTLNRENVPPHDDWNRSLVSQTADLLVHSLRWLRDNDRLGVSALLCLPLEKSHFIDYLRAPLFDKIQEALSTEPTAPQIRRRVRLRQPRAACSHRRLARPIPAIPDQFYIRGLAKSG